tara:strand:+ start:3923 stop:4288 length:366 start_codon:yes stop_codon:yes gene_type:complete
MLIRYALNAVIMFFSIQIVIFIEYYAKNIFLQPLYNSKYVYFDIWSLVHVLSTCILALYYPYRLSITAYLNFILGWECIENIFLPNISDYFVFCKETQQDMLGDLFAAIPGLFILCIKNSK